MPSETWLEMADLWNCGCCGSGWKQFPLENVKTGKDVALGELKFELFTCLLKLTNTNTFSHTNLHFSFSFSFGKLCTIGK